MKKIFAVLFGFAIVLNALATSKEDLAGYEFIGSATIYSIADGGLSTYFVAMSGGDYVGYVSDDLTLAPLILEGYTKMRVYARKFFFRGRQHAAYILEVKDKYFKATACPVLGDCVIERNLKSQSGDDVFEVTYKGRRVFLRLTRCECIPYYAEGIEKGYIMTSPSGGSHSYTLVIKDKAYQVSTL